MISDELPLRAQRLYRFCDRRIIVCMGKKRADKQEDQVTITFRIPAELSDLFQKYIDSHKYKPSRQQVLETLLEDELKKFKNAISESGE